MIGITEPPFTCPYCGLVEDTLTAISRHDLECASRPRPRAAARSDSREISSHPAKKLRANTKGKFLMPAPPFCPLPPPKTTPHHDAAPQAAPQDRRRWSWLEFRVQVFLMLFALRDRRAMRHSVEGKT